MRNVATRDDIIGTLKRSNKNFNKNDIRFSAEGGGINLNGVPVDILEFGNMQKPHQAILLEKLPSVPENHATVGLNQNIENIQVNSNLSGILGSPCPLIMGVLANLNDDIQKKIIDICQMFINKIDIDTITELTQLLPGDIISQIMEYVVGFIKKCAVDIMNVFQRRLLNEDAAFVCQDFGFKNTHMLMKDIITYVVDRFSNNNMMDTLKTEFEIWHASLIYGEQKKTERKKKRHTGSVKYEKNCPICGGYYYEINK